ncbi:hypothetical protein ES703_123519 [subsurface metagenome]
MKHRLAFRIIFFDQSDAEIRDSSPWNAGGNRDSSYRGVLGKHIFYRCEILLDVDPSSERENEFLLFFKSQILILHEVELPVHG